MNVVRQCMCLFLLYGVLRAFEPTTPNEKLEKNIAAFSEDIKTVQGIKDLIPIARKLARSASSSADKRYQIALTLSGHHTGCELNFFK